MVAPTILATKDRVLTGIVEPVAAAKGARTIYLHEAPARKIVINSVALTLRWSVGIGLSTVLGRNNLRTRVAIAVAEIKATLLTLGRVGTKIVGHDLPIAGLASAIHKIISDGRSCGSRRGAVFFVVFGAADGQQASE